MTEASTNGTGTRAERRAAVARPANGRNTTQPNLQERGSGLPERALNYASTGALEDPARPWKRELDDMIQRDPQIQAVMIALILPLLTAEGHVEPGDKDSGEAEFIEQCLTAPEWDGGMTTPIHMILEQEATAMFYRQAFFEKVWLRDADGKFRYKKLAFRPATTCRIRHDIGEGPNGSGNGSFNGFMQEGVRPGSGEWFTEEFDPLYAYVFVHGHAQRPLLGTSLLQTAWHEHMHKNKLRWLQFRGFAKWGNGILVAETERMDDVEQEALTDALNEVLDGGALVVGEGEMPQLLTASGSAGFLEVLQYIDTGIARSVLLQALQLGTGSNTGSWALSKDHTDFYLMSCEARLRQIEYTRNAYMIPPLIEQNYPGTPSYPTWHFPGLSEEGKELAKEIFIALLGRPQASVHPVIKATVEKTVAQKLGGDPDNIPEWDDPEREVEQVPPDAAADTEPTNDPQRAAEAGALASSLQALRGETGQRAASEQGDTPLGESVTYERFLELADLYGDDEAERLLAGALVARLRKDPKVHDPEALAAWIGRHHHKPGVKGVNKGEGSSAKPSGTTATIPDTPPIKEIKKPPALPKKPQERILGVGSMQGQVYRDVIPRPDKLKAKERKLLANDDNYRLITPDTLKPKVLTEAHQRISGVNDGLDQMFPDNPNDWSGETRFSTVDESDRHHAAFDPIKGTIDIAPYLTEDRDGFKHSTLIHEVFHAHTPGDRQEFSRYRGFEEGLAEQMTRLHRKELLTPVVGEEEADRIDRQGQSQYDNSTAYKGYVDALEAYRAHTGEDERAFYNDLYRTPLEKRSDHLQAKAGKWIEAKHGKGTPEAERARKAVQKADDFLRRGEGEFNA